MVPDCAAFLGEAEADDPSVTGSGPVAWRSNGPKPQRIPAIAEKAANAAPSLSAAEPEDRDLSWFALPFTAGMGIGLLFLGIAEPLRHDATPPVGGGKTVEAAQRARVLTFLHRGVHAWAIYIVVGSALANYRVPSRPAADGSLRPAGRAPLSRPRADLRG